MIPAPLSCTESVVYAVMNFAVGCPSLSTDTVQPRPTLSQMLTSNTSQSRSPGGFFLFESVHNAPLCIAQHQNCDAIQDTGCIAPCSAGSAIECDVEINISAVT